MTSLIHSFLAVLLFATPSLAEDGGEAAFHDSTCSISVKKSDLFSRGTTLRVEGAQGARDAVALDGDVVVRAGATVKDVVAMRGNVTVEAGARVLGKVVALGGDVHVAEGAILEGDVSALGGRVHAAPGATLRGEKNELSLEVNGKDPVQLFMGQLFSGKAFAHCKLRVTEE
jgi:hypothetical protein